MEEYGKKSAYLKPRILEPKTPMSRRDILSKEKDFDEPPQTPFSKSQYSSTISKEWEDRPSEEIKTTKDLEAKPEMSSQARSILNWALGKGQEQTHLVGNDLLEEGRTKYVYKLESSHRVSQVFVKSKLALSFVEKREKPALSFEVLDKFLASFNKIRNFTKTQMNDAKLSNVPSLNRPLPEYLQKIVDYASTPRAPLLSPKQPTRISVNATEGEIAYEGGLFGYSKDLPILSRVRGTQTDVADADNDLEEEHEDEDDEDTQQTTNKPTKRHKAQNK